MRRRGNRTSLTSTRGARAACPHAQLARPANPRAQPSRVANPRALGMLRRWHNLALSRAEQLRKLRRAYSLLAHGTITRVVREWCGLVRRRHMVRERVARLLGAVLDATFHAWARLWRRRAACREAYAEAMALRKERVCSDTLVRWTYGAHLSSSLPAVPSTPASRAITAELSAPPSSGSVPEDE